MSHLNSHIKSLKADPLHELWQRVPNCLLEMLPQGIPESTQHFIDTFSEKELTFHGAIEHFEWADEIASIDQSKSDYEYADKCYVSAEDARQQYLEAFSVLISSLPSEEASRVASFMLTSEAETIIQKRNQDVVEQPGAELISSIVIPESSTSEAAIQIIYSPLRAILAKAISDYEFFFHFARYHREFEIFIADCYKLAGWSHVELTPQRGDGGRDVIATRNDIGTIRILEQTKAYAPGTLVTHHDVRAMIGVLSIDRSASKGIITTTSDFQPTIQRSEEFTPYMPSRLELRNGNNLREWLRSLHHQTTSGKQ